MPSTTISLVILSFALPFARAQGQSVPSLGTQTPTTPVAAAWWTSWHATEGAPLSAVSWDKYNTLIYSFASTSPSVHELSLDNPNLLSDFVRESHAHGVAAHAAIGGWSGSRWFSSNVATPENRTAFVQTVSNFASQYKLDGINFDWEYPNRQGIGCNTINMNDAQNFLSFLQELRLTPVGAKLTLSAATLVTTFLNVYANPSTDVSGFAAVLDYITIMDYDVWGSSSPSVGPNAPLDDTCVSGDHQQGSAVSSLRDWTAAGMPVNKIVLGVASYGHSYSVPPDEAFVRGSQTELAAYPAFDGLHQPLGDHWDDVGFTDTCNIYEDAGGTWNFWGLIDGGYLTREGNPAPGINYRFDSCSQTPYVYNKTSQVMISYDNAQSFAAKGNFIKENGLKGFAMWEAGGDYQDTLLDSIRAALGHSSGTPAGSTAAALSVPTGSAPAGFPPAGNTPSGLPTAGSSGFLAMLPLAVHFVLPTPPV